MTMSDHQTTPAAPLDLSTNPRDLGDRRNSIPGSTDGLRGTTEVRKSPANHHKSKNSRRTSIAEPRNSSSGSQTERHCGDDTPLRSSNTPVSKLPFRKRPFHQNCTDPQDATPKRRILVHEPHTWGEYKSSRNHGNHFRSDLQSQPVSPNAVRNVSQDIGDCSRRQISSTYFHSVHPWHQHHPSIPGLIQCQTPGSAAHTPPHQLDETDRLSADAAQATYQDEDGDTALHIAVVQGTEALVYSLIHILERTQKDLDIFNNMRQTPLHLAVITGHVALVHALLRAGADPGAPDRNGQTSLHLCCEHRRAECLFQILSLCPSFPSSWLDTRNYEGLTPLHLAVQNEDKELAKILVDCGADINAADVKSGRSPLVHAVENNSIEMVNFLIENGCHVNSQSYSGNTALHSACGRGYVDAVRALLKNGADSSLKNYHNDTAVMVSTNKKVTDVLRGRGTRTLKTQANQTEKYSLLMSAPHSQRTSSIGCPSPNSPGHSPVPAPTSVASHFQHSASLSPMAQPLHSPLSQSGESLSGRQSPLESQTKEELQKRLGLTSMGAENTAGQRQSLNTFRFLPAGYDPHVSSFPHGHVDILMPGHTTYCVPSLHRIYSTETGHFLLPNRAHPSSSTLCHHSHLIDSQLRPSSQSSDQSDMSTMSASSDGKGES